MYGTSHTGLGALLLLLVAFLHKMLATLYDWGTQRAHRLWFHGKQYQWKTRDGLTDSITHGRHVIMRITNLIRQQRH
jgi:hypothetical protein